MEFGELLNQFLIDLQALFRTHTKSLNLTLPQIMLLSSIPRDGIDMTSLSRRLGVDNSTLTRLIDVLAKNRYVQKNKHPSDKRSILVNLTEQGEMLHSSIESERSVQKLCLHSLFRCMLQLNYEPYIMWNTSNVFHTGNRLY